MRTFMMNESGPFTADEYIVLSGTAAMPHYDDHMTNLSTLSASGDVDAEDASDYVSASLVSTRFVVQTIITPVVVSIGLLGNLLNVLVLVQPSMRTSTNVYLLALSVADIVYLIFSFALSFVGCRREGLSYAAYAFNTYGRTISDMAGNVAVWIIVIFTVERYVAVCHPMHGKIWCTVTRAKLFSLGATVFCFVNTMPGFFELEIVVDSDGPKCMYTQFAQTPAYELGYTWWYVSIFTFIPFVFLLIFNSLLIHALIHANRERELMMTAQGKSVGGRVYRDGSSGRQRFTEAGKKGRRSGCFCFCCGDGDFERNPEMVEYVDQTSKGVCARTVAVLLCCFKERGACFRERKGCVRAGSSMWESSCAESRRTERESVHSKWSVKSRTAQDGCEVMRTQSNRSALGPKLLDVRPSADRENSDKQGEDADSDIVCDALIKGQNRRGSRTLYGTTPTLATPNSSRRPSSNSGHYSPCVSLREHGRHHKRSHEQHKVTLMLIVIVIIFFICQLPWTILYLYRAYLSAHNASAAGSDSIKIAGNVVNLLAQVNASGNFYLYSFFSKKFRRTLTRLFVFWKAELSSVSVHV